MADDDIYGTSPVPVYTVVLSSSNSRVTVGTISQTIITVNDDDGETIVNLRFGITIYIDAVVSMVTGTMTTTEGDIAIVCANLVSPSSGTSVPITVLSTWNNGGSIYILLLSLCDYSNYVGTTSIVTFSANSNAQACIQLRVEDDDIYGTSPPVYTVVLSSPNSRVTVGDISQTTITVSDDDGMSVMCVLYIIIISFIHCRCHY